MASPVCVHKFLQFGYINLIGPCSLLQVGFKLLAADVKIASRLVRRVLQGKNLTRCGCYPCALQQMRGKF